MTRRSDRGRGGEGNLEDAARRFQETVEDLAARAGDEMGERAAAFLDDAADRLRGDREDTSGSRERRSGSRRRRGRDRHYGPYWHGSSARGPQGRSGLYGDYQPWEWRSRKLYLDDENGKLVGVCAGIAKYFGMEGWVVRCIAVTGLIFMPSIVFPAYWVAYFVMDHAPEGEGEETGKGKGKRRRGKRRRRRERDARRAESPDANAEDRARRDHTAPAPEMGVRFSPRRSLRAVQADFTELELRLRRMESHVTSGQFELQRELHRIDK